MIKIGILTMMFERHDLTNVVFDYYKDLKESLIKEDIELVLITSGSEGAVSREIAKRNCFNYIELENRPLSLKLENTFLFARNFDLDGIILIGSDDIISKQYFVYCANLLKKNRFKPFISGFLDIYVSLGDKFKHWRGYSNERKGETAGAGRLINKLALERANYSFYSAKKINKGLDLLFTRKAKLLNIEHITYYMSDRVGYIIDIKTPNNLTAFESMIGDERQKSEIINKFPDLKNNQFINRKKPLQSIRLDYKPLSVNEAWRGKRFKTPEYKYYESDLYFLLPSRIEIPKGKLHLILKFGFSSKNADIDNPVKLFQDILQKKYSFNDKMIYKLSVEKIDVEKGNEFIEFKIESL